MSHLDTPLTIENQILLMRKYVSFRQKTKMKQLLQNEGYFRVSRYGKYLLSYTHLLKSKPNQSLLFELYEFDVELREVFYRYTQKAEIQLKNHISNAISLYLEDPTFYLKETSYTATQGEHDKNKRETHRKKFREFFKKIKDAESSLIYKLNKYPELKEYRRGGSRHRKRIPAWTAFMYFDFGNIEYMYAYLRLDLKKEVLAYGYPNTTRKISKIDTKNMDTWIAAIRNLRNVCSHHNMLVGKTSSIVHLDSLDASELLPNSTDLFSRMYALKKVLNSKDSEALKVDLKKLIRKTKLDVYTLNILPPTWESLYDKIHSF